MHVAIRDYNQLIKRRGLKQIKIEFHGNWCKPVHINQGMFSGISHALCDNEDVVHV